jgi:hypothetical protein
MRRRCKHQGARTTIETKVVSRLVYFLASVSISYLIRAISALMPVHQQTCSRYLSSSLYTHSRGNDRISLRLFTTGVGRRTYTEPKASTKLDFRWPQNLRSPIFEDQILQCHTIDDNVHRQKNYQDASVERRVHLVALMNTSELLPLTEMPAYPRSARASPHLLA